MLSTNRKIALYSAIIICLLIAVFYKVHNFEFINFDDNVYVSENPAVLAGLSKDGLHWAFYSTAGGHWHPLSWISHMADIELFGINPKAMHLINAGIHLANCLLLFSLIVITIKNAEIALISALIWGIHPLRMESVAWISQRKDLLSLFFGLGSCLLFVKYILTGSLWKYALSIFSFTLALLSKPSMMTLPALLLIVEITARSRAAIPGRFFALKSHINKLPFFTLALLCAAIAVFSQDSGGGLRTLQEFPVSRRLNIAFPAYLAYLGKLFWPFNSTIYYPVVNYPSGLAFSCFFAVLLISCVLWKSRQQYSELLIGWIWFIIALLPVAGFVTIGSQAFADRWTLLAHIGLIIALTSFCIRKYRHYTIILSCPLIFCLSFISYKELDYWKNSESIFRRSLVINPDNFMAHTNLGAALNSAENFDEKSFHYEEAVRLNPTYPEALNNLGIIRAQQGRFAEAVSLFEKAVVINPDLVVARQNLAQARQDMRIRGR